MPIQMPLGPIMIDVESLKLTVNDKKRLSHPLVGSVILFRKNYHNKAQLEYLCEEIKALRSPELLIAVDQEGGRLQNLEKDFFRLPSLHTFAKVFDRSPARAAQLLRAHALVMVTEIQSVGIDFSFTPVVDLMMPESHIIGDRAFHSNPAIVAEMAKVYISALNQFGCIGVAKHFPGHGSVIEDSHVTLPQDKRELADMMKTDLLPYQTLAKCGLDALMTAHVHFPNIDSHLPSFSSFWLKKVLRDSLQFKGIVFCENLTMDGALANIDSVPNLSSIPCSMAQRVVKSLDSGCDIAIVAGDLTKVDALLDDELSHALIQQLDNDNYQGGERLRRQRQKRFEDQRRQSKNAYDEAKSLLLKLT